MKILNYWILAILLLSLFACQEEQKSSNADDAANAAASTAKESNVYIPNDALEIQEDVVIEPPHTAEPPPPPPLLHEIAEEEIYFDQSIKTDNKVHKKVGSTAYSMSPPPPPPPPTEAEIFKIIQKEQPAIEETRPFNTESYAHIPENDFKEVLENPLSTFSIDVDRASYSNCRRYLNRGQIPPPGSIRIEEFVNYFDYDYPQPDDKDPFSVNTEIGPCPWNPEHKLLHIGLQGKSIEQEKLPPANLVFLLDVSGSMRSSYKLPLLKSAFKLLINQLREEDMVSIVTYAGSSGLVLPPTSGSNKQKIRDALDQLSAGGSTAGASGIQLAYQVAQENFLRKGNNRVILATDGDFNVGLSSDAALVQLIEEKRNKGVFLSVLSFGSGNYQDTKMEQLADNGNGNYAYIDNIKEAKKTLVNEMGSTLFTIAKDVKLQLEFNPNHVQAYRLLGYENRVLKKEDFNNDKKDAGDIGAGHSVTAVYELIPANSKNSQALLTSVDPLKYQKTKKLSNAANSSEWATVKLRYKKPDSNTSKLLSVTVDDTDSSLRQTSDNYRLSAGIIAYAMLLKKSKYTQDCTYQMAIELIESLSQKDEYKKELLGLIEIAAQLE